MSNWRSVFAAGILGVWIGQGSYSGQSLGAAPNDVHGSPNVPVQSYRNRNGSFVVWADGHITNAMTGNTVNPPKEVSDSYLDSAVDGFSKPGITNGSPLGSPYVPISVVQTSKGSFVLFADGSTMKPKDINAAAAPIVTSAIRWARYDSTSNTVVGSSGDISVVHTGQGSYTVTFTPPFTKTPSVVCTTAETGFLGFTRDCVTDHASVQCRQLQTVPTTMTLPIDSDFCVWATADE
ncbi:hypothetical protein IV102_03495 [bacterium]|nr:hypothetical protein [bacterium]